MARRFWLIMATLATMVLYLASRSPVIVLAGVGMILLAEGWHFARIRRVSSPHALFAIGWLFPFVLAQIPIGSIYFSAEPLSSSAELVGFGVVLAFYGAGFAADTVRRVKRWRPREPVPAKIPTLMVVLLMLASNGGYLWSLAAAHFQIPILAEHVSKAAASFFAPKGSATAFKLGEVGLVLAVLKYTRVSPRSVHRFSRYVVVGFVLLYLLEELLYGKRMDLLLSILVVAVLFSLRSRVRLKPRYLTLGALFLLAVVFGNAYVRSVYDYRAYWQGSTRGAVSGPLELALSQPIWYVHGAFSALGRIVDDPTRTFTGGVYTFEKHTPADFARPANQYEALRQKSKMVTFLGAPIADFGVSVSLVATFLSFLCFFLLYTVSSSPTGAALYAIVGSRIAVVWTGNPLVSLLSAILLLTTVLVFPTATSLRAVASRPAEGVRD